VLAWSAVLFWLQWLVRLVMLPVVVRRKSQPTVCLAWLTIIFLVPFVGLAAYLLIGKVRLGARRIRRYTRDVDIVARANRPDIQLRHIVEPEIEKTQQVILHVADQLGGLPVLGGNAADLLSETNTVIDRLVQDIDQARHHAHLLFYIFAADEMGERVAAALVRARSRGVQCQLLVDAVGSRGFLRALAPKLAGKGIEVVPALPVNPVRRLFARLDLRNHRKLAVIDGWIAYTGSQNVVRADYGKKGRASGAT
jgi:cardiolipin synthase